MKVDDFDYPIDLAQQLEVGFLVTFLDIPEAITAGADEGEALLTACDALEAAFSFYIHPGAPLLVPGNPRRGQRTVRPSALECAKPICARRRARRTERAEQD